MPVVLWRTELGRIQPNGAGGFGPIHGAGSDANPSARERKTQGMRSRRDKPCGSLKRARSFRNIAARGRISHRGSAISASMAPTGTNLPVGARHGGLQVHFAIHTSDIR